MIHITKETLNIGIISEEQLVDIFATTSQKNKYYELNKFSGANKTTLLTEANRWCTIKDLGNRQYEIIEVFKYPKHKSLTKAKKGLYQYITPLILINLIDGHDKNNKITLTIGKWARQIKMINHNYNLVKYNRCNASNELKLKIESIDEFYDKSDSMINDYITNTLKYLDQMGLIIWRKVNIIRKEIINPNNLIVTENNNIITDLTIECHQASEEEMDYYARCIEIADKEANITNKSERYYSSKSNHYNSVLIRELNKQNIKMIYSTYEVYYIHLDKCKDILNEYENIEQAQLIEKFNKEFSEMLLNNADIRFDKNTYKYLAKGYENKDDFKYDFSNLCDIVINNKTEYLGDRIKQNTYEEKYSLKFNVQYKGDK